MKNYKFSKRKCKTCIYHRGGSQGKGAIYCNYASITDHTCLHMEDIDGVRTIVDSRGDDYYNCKLYKKGQITPSVVHPM